MTEALAGFAPYIEPPRRGSGGSATGLMFITVIKTSPNGTFSFSFSLALAAAVSAGKYGISINAEKRQLAFLSAPVGYSLNTSKNGLSRMPCTQLIRFLGLKPGARMPAHVVDGVLFIDYSGAIAPAALSAAAD